MGLLSLTDQYPYFAQHPAARDRFVGLVGCGKVKRAGSWRAADLYTGGYTRTMMTWAARNCRDWAILSAKHFVLRPDQVVKSYDLTLSEFSPYERDLWGNWARKRLALLFPGRKFLLLAGRHYADGLALSPGTFVDLFDRPGNWSMGYRMQWLLRNPVLTNEVLAEVTQGKS